MRYMDVTLAPEDIEWSTPDAWGGLKEAVFDDARFEVFVDEWPDLHPVLDLRYGIADALWDAGYRKVSS